MSTGENIRRLRESKGLFQKELAEAANVYQAKISRIENGKTRVIKPEILQKIADALDVSVADLVDAPKRRVDFDYVVDTPAGPVGFEVKTQGYDTDAFLVDFLSLDSQTRALVKDFVRAAKQRAVSGQGELPLEGAGDDNSST